MKKQTHYIQKEQLILDFSTEEKARHWHKTAFTFFHQQILPQLSEILDQYVPEDQYFAINRLEIDIGMVRDDELQEAIVKQVKAELIRILKSESISRFSKVANTASAQQALPGETVLLKESEEHLLESFYYFLDYGILPWNSDFKNMLMLEAEISQKIGIEKLITYPDFQKRLRIEFIRKRLYFQFSPPLVEVVFSHVYQPELSLLHSLQEKLLQVLKSLAKDGLSQEIIREELWVWIGSAAPADTTHWPQDFIRWSLQKASPYVTPIGEKAMVKAILQELLKADKSEYANALLLAQLQVLYPSLDKEIIASAKTSSADRLNTLKADESDERPGSATVAKNYSLKKQVSPEVDKSNPVTEKNEDDMEKLSRDETARLTESAHHPKEEAEGAGFSSIISSTVKGEENMDSSPFPISATKRSVDDETVRPSIPLEKAHKPSKEELLNLNAATWQLEARDEDAIQQNYLPELEGYYLRHAGVILTWPYLDRLFKHVGYLDESTFRDLQYQQRAVHLLAYIASGQEQCEEQELAIAKFLCAWPLQMPMVKTLELTNEEKNEADQMLHSLIENWSILKNTSVDGLRASFFSREGKLLKEDVQWRLLVEQKSYDMLLDHLPYTISIIKLPWMKSVLKVDWA